jgi:cytochrome c
MRSLVFTGVLGCFAVVGNATADESKSAGYYGYGMPATAEQIAGWDIDVRPDGLGLPEGSGTVEDGEWLFEEKCASCHGTFGEGVKGYPSLAGGEGTLTGGRPHKTVGSYWNYTSTLWDYVHRAMPYTAPRSLSADETYALSAYVLFLNDLVEYEFELNQDNLAEVRLPNEPNFIPEQRPDVANERCMSECRDPAAIEIVSEAPPLEADESEEEAVEIASGPSGKEIYTRYCQLCHADGLAGAPKVGDVPAWAARSKAGIATLYKHAIEGFQGEAGMMPPKGGFSQLSDEEVQASVDYMLEESQ